jgi:hypothetical protein
MYTETGGVPSFTDIEAIRRAQVQATSPAADERERLLEKRRIALQDPLADLLKEAIAAFDDLASQATTGEDLQAESLLRLKPWIARKWMPYTEDSGKWTERQEGQILTIGSGPHALEITKTTQNANNPWDGPIFDWRIKDSIPTSEDTYREIQIYRRGDFFNPYHPEGRMVLLSQHFFNPTNKDQQGKPTHPGAQSFDYMNGFVNAETYMQLVSLDIRHALGQFSLVETVDSKMAA